MRNIVLTVAIAGITAIAIPAHADNGVSESISLRYALPSHVLAALAPSPGAANGQVRLHGIDYVAADDPDRRIAVRGTAEGVRDFKSLVAQLDVPRDLARLDVSVIRLEWQGARQTGRRVVGRAVYRASSGDRLKMAGGDGDATFDLDAQVSVFGGAMCQLSGVFTASQVGGASDVSQGLRRVRYGARTAAFETGFGAGPAAEGQAVPRRASYVVEVMARRDTAGGDVK